MKFFDVSVPSDAALPTYPGNTPFSLDATERIARGDGSNVSPLHVSARGGTLPVEAFKAPGAPACVVLGRS